MELDELDTVSSEEICKEITVAARTLRAAVAEIDQRGRKILKRVEVEPLWGSEMELFPRMTTLKWLKSELCFVKETYTFDEFMCFFLDLYAGEGRLDFETFSLKLRKADAAILELSAEVPVTLFQVISKLPILFK
jgi:hypothetical protein